MCEVQLPVAVKSESENGTDSEEESTTETAGRRRHRDLITERQQERYRILKEDPAIGLIWRHKVQCIPCERVVRLKPGLSYVLDKWDKHVKSARHRKITGNCPSGFEKICQKKVQSVAKRKEFLLSQPLLSKGGSVQKDKLHCNACGVWIKLDPRNRGYGLGHWMRHVLEQHESNIKDLVDSMTAIKQHESVDGEEHNDDHGTHVTSREATEDVKAKSESPEILDPHDVMDVDINEASSTSTPPNITDNASSSSGGESYTSDLGVSRHRNPAQENDSTTNLAASMRRSSRRVATRRSHAMDLASEDSDGDLPTPSKRLLQIAADKRKKAFQKDPEISTRSDAVQVDKVRCGPCDKWVNLRPEHRPFGFSLWNHHKKTKMHQRNVCLQSDASTSDVVKSGNVMDESDSDITVFSAAVDKRATHGRTVVDRSLQAAASQAVSKRPFTCLGNVNSDANDVGLTSSNYYIGVKSRRALNDLGGARCTSTSACPIPLVDYDSDD